MKGFFSSVHGGRYCEGDWPDFLYNKLQFHVLMLPQSALAELMKPNFLRIYVLSFLSLRTAVHTA